MSRYALMLLASALLLIAAACESNGDDDATENGADDSTELPADDEGNGEEDTTVPEDDESTETEDESTDTEDDEVAEGTEDDTDESTNGDGEGESEGEEGNGEDQDGTDEEGQTGDDESTGEESETGAEEGTGDEEEAVDPDQQDPDAAEADPNQGVFFDLSVEEANEMTDFEVREPQEVPESLEFQTIMGMASQEATEEEMEDEAATITFAYQQPPEDEQTQGLPVEFMQSSELDMSQGLGEQAEQEEVTIGDRDVTRITMSAETGDEILAYVWTEDDIHFSLAAILGGDLEESDLEAMIESVPAA